MGDKFGFIDPTGQMVIPPQFDTAAEFSESRAGVEIGGKWGCVDMNGNMAVSPQSFGSLR